MHQHEHEHNNLEDAFYAAVLGIELALLLMPLIFLLMDYLDAKTRLLNMRTAEIQHRIQYAYPPQDIPDTPCKEEESDDPSDR